MILAQHQQQLSLHQDLLPSLVRLLHNEGITKEKLPATGGMEVLLTAVQEAVCVNYENLEKFAAILQFFTATVSVSDAILKDYRKVFSDNSSADDSATDGEEGEGSLEIYIPRSLNRDFQTMRTKFASTLQKVSKALKVSVMDLKSYCQLGYPHLKPQLDNCKTILDVMQVISERCTLTNIILLEGVVNHFKIRKAKLAIQKYKESIEEFCQTMSFQLSLNEKFSSPSPLQCQTATFVVNKDVEKTTLNDIDDLMKHAFEKLSPNVRVIVIKESKSFTITCSFPVTLSESLIAIALHNLDILVQKERLLQLTIGYSTVYSYDEAKTISKNKEAHVMNSMKSSVAEWVTAVYTSSGTLEQMIVSQSVQHAMDNEEIGQLARCMLEERQKFIEALNTSEYELREKLSTREKQTRAMTLENEQLQSSLQSTKAELEEAKDNVLSLNVQMKEREDKNHQLLKDIQSLQFQLVELRTQLLTERDQEKPSSVKPAEPDSQHMTIQESTMEIMESLFADTYIQRKHQQTVLILACERGNHSVIEALLKRNVNVDILLQNGSTALILAGQNGHHTVVKLLLEAKANCNIKDREKRTTLIAASEGGHYKVIELLVQQQQTELNSVDKNGYTALHHACQNGSIEIVSLLLQKQANNRSCTNNGSTALMLASQHKHLPIIELLYAHNQYYSCYEGLEAISVADSPEIVHLLADKCNISDHSTLTIEQLKTVAKKEMEKGDTGEVNWYSNRVKLTSPSVQQCREVIADLKDNHCIVQLWHSSAAIVLLLLPAVLQRESVKKLEIRYASLPLHCMQCLTHLLTVNKSLETLLLSWSAITDELLDSLCSSLQHNNTLTSLDLYGNDGITSNSALSLSNLVLANSILTELDLRLTSLSSDGVIILLNSLTDNKTLKILKLDRKHETTCRQHPNHTLIEHRLVYSRY